MFWNSPPKPDQKAKDDHEWRQLGFVGVLLLGLFVYQKTSRLSPNEVFWLKVKFAMLIAMIVGAFFSYYKWKKDAPKRAKKRELRPLFLNPTKLPVGRTGNGIELGISDHVRTGHTQIIGATGRGKTESVILPWASYDAIRGKDLLLIDGKGDLGLYQRLALYMRGQERFVFNLSWANAKSTQVVANPLRYGSAQQITDRLFTAFDFEDPYYRAVQYSLVSLVVKLIKANPERNQTEGVVTFKRLYDLLTNDEMLRSYSSKASSFDQRKIMDFLNKRREDRLQDISGLLSQIEPFAMGEVSRMVNAEGNEDGFVSISKLVLNLPDEGDPRIPVHFKSKNINPRCYVFLLPTLLYQKLSHQLGKLFLQELGWAIGERETRGGENDFLPVYLDEFSSFVYKGFENILNKARSANVALHLSHQSVGDLRMVSPDFATVINSNTNIKCILGVNDPETAEHFASHLGTTSTPGSRSATQLYQRRFLAANPTGCWLRNLSPLFGVRLSGSY